MAWSALVDFAESSDPDTLVTAIVQAARASVVFETANLASDTSMALFVEGTASIATGIAGDLIRMLRDCRQLRFDKCRLLPTFAAIGWVQAYSSGNSACVTGLTEPQLEDRGCRW